MSFFTVLVGSKIAMGALVVGTIAAGGTVAAAYTGSLPAPLQQSAHSLIGAPAPTASVTATATATPTPTDTATATPTPIATPVGPDATGPAAYGLCQAYTRGGLATSSIAYTSLVTAANGAANITGYCATIASPGQSAAHRPTAGVGAGATSGQSASHRPTSTGGVSATSQPVAPVAPQAAVGSAHKPATAGRP